MIKAGALYFSIIIAFFIALISASLIMLAAHYRNSFAKEIRFNRLQNNLSAGIKYVLASSYDQDLETIDLYSNEADSLIIEHKKWGFYELAVIKTFIHQDTLKKAILIGVKSDSTVIYLSDEDKSLSVSGTTKITGNVELPKAGIKKSYAEGKPYSNAQLIYDGNKYFSSNTLKPINQQILKSIIDKLGSRNEHLPMLSVSELKASFLTSSQNFRLSPNAHLKNVNLNGNILLFSDSSVTISADSKLSGIQVFAPFIKIEDGFIGDFQLFATDSINIGNNVKLNYPTVAAVIRPDNFGKSAMISLGNNVVFSGILFSYEQKKSKLETTISFGKHNLIKGEVFCDGSLKLNQGSKVEGKVSCNRFLMQTNTSLYENLLIDVNLNINLRSRYYLSAGLFNIRNENEVLKWLN